MAKTIQTLNIGAANIALAEYELGAKGAVKLLKYGVAELASPLDGGNVETILAPALREIIGAKGFKPGKLALAISGQMTFPKFASIPMVGGAEKFEQLVRYEIEQGIPFPIDEMVCDRQVLGDTENGDKAVMIVAAKIAQVEALTNAVRAAGFTPEIVDSAPTALTNAVRFNHPEEADSCVVTLWLGTKGTSLIITEGDKMYTRLIQVGGATLLKEVGGAFGCSPEEAQRLIDGQALSWSEARPLLPGTSVRYFLDETILVLVWQEEVQGSVGTFAEVCFADGSQLRRKLAGDSFMSGEYEVATELSRQCNAVLACSGDYYMINGIQYGVCVYDRELLCSYLPIGDVCYFTENGDMLFSRGGQFADEDELRRFLADNAVTFSLSFGPILIEDGRDVTPDDYHLGEINEGYARSAIGQLGQRHYLSMTLNVAPNYNVYPLLRTATEAMLSHGCVKAFALDGGQTGSIILNHELINPVQFGYERQTSDIFYFATALN